MRCRYFTRCSINLLPAVLVTAVELGPDSSTAVFAEPVACWVQADYDRQRRRDLLALTRACSRREATLPTKHRVASLMVTVFLLQPNAWLGVTRGMAAPGLCKVLQYPGPACLGWKQWLPIAICSSPGGGERFYCQNARVIATTDTSIAIVSIASAGSTGVCQRMVPTFRAQDLLLIYY
jgi:hypothetical protein